MLQGELFEGKIRLLQGEPYVTCPWGSVVRWRSSLSRTEECQVVDIVWMRLKTGAPKTRSARARRELIEATSRLPGLVKAHGALDVEDARKVAVMIGSKTRSVGHVSCLADWVV